MDENEQEQLASAPPVSLGADVPVCRALPETTEFRATEDGEGEDGSPGTMVGHFSTFGDWYEINSWFEGHFLERVSAGAFKRTLKNRSDETPIRVLLEHGFDPQVGDKPLGVPSRMEEREGGPYAEVPLFDTTYNRDLAPALRAGAYGQSFRFVVLRDEWDNEPEPGDHNPAGIPERTIKEVRVIEFGPTVFPANPKADAGLRSTTDAFYERLRSRQPDKYAELVARTASIRLPQRGDDAAPETPPAIEQEDRKTEDPPTRHSEDPPSNADAPTGDALPATHSEDPPTSTHSTATRSSTTKEGTDMDETMTVEERKARQQEIRSRQQEIDNDHTGSALPEDVQAEWNALRSEYDVHEEAIAAATERMDYLRTVASAQEGENPGTTPSRTFRRSASPAPVRKGPENVFDLSSYRREARSIDDLGALYRDGAARVIDGGKFAGAPDRSAAQERALRLIDTVDDKAGTLARRIIATGSPVYERAFGKATMAGSTDGLTTEERTALSTTTTAGGYAVPFDLDPTVILTSNGVINPLRAVARQVQVVGNTWQGVTSGGITVSRSAEADQVGDDSPGNFGQPEVKVERVTGFIPFSMEIEQDWSAMRAELTLMLQDAKDTEEADSFLNGNGTPPAASGLLTGATSLVPLGTTNVLASSDLYAVEEDLPPRYRSMAAWLANRSFFNTVRSLGEDSDGGNLWVRLASGLPPELIGYPIHEASEMPALALNVDDSPLAVFGDFRQFLIVDKVGMNIELVPHLLGADRRPNGQRGILAVWRNNCEVLVPTAFRVLTGNDGI